MGYTLEKVPIQRYFTEEATHALAAYFGRVRRGYDEEVRTPLFDKAPLSDIIGGWMSIVENSDLPEEWPTLWDYENDQATKVGPMSIMKPLAERMPDIESYFTSVEKKAKPLPLKAVEAVIKEWRLDGTWTIRDRELTWDKMRKSTNSGAPYFTKRRDLRLQALSSVVRFDEGTVWLSDLTGDKEGCAVLGWRGQEGGPEMDDVKQRVVWMFPMTVNLAELSVYQPLIEHLQSQNSVPAWVSMSEVDRRVTDLFDTKDSRDPIICTDFTKFDQHFNPCLQDAAFAILRAAFSADPRWMDWATSVFPIKYRIPIMYDFGRIMSGHHGMASGSGGTNADETCAHRALQYEAAHHVGSELNPNSQCLGDDGMISYPGAKVSDVVKVYTSHGLDMNPKKQTVSTDDCVYLRRWHHKLYRENGICVGVYPTCRALGRLCEQERFYDPDKWSREMVALRQLSILENVKYHPLREEFVRYVLKGDKYRLGLDIPGFFDNLESKANEAQGLYNDFLGYTRTEMSEGEGISDWWIVKYLRTL